MILGTLVTGDLRLVDSFQPCDKGEADRRMFFIIVSPRSFSGSGTSYYLMEWDRRCVIVCASHNLGESSILFFPFEASNFRKLPSRVVCHSVFFTPTCYYTSSPWACQKRCLASSFIFWAWRRRLSKSRHFPPRFSLDGTWSGSGCDYWRIVLRGTDSGVLCKTPCGSTRTCPPPTSGSSHRPCFTIVVSRVF